MKRRKAFISVLYHLSVILLPLGCFLSAACSGNHSLRQQQLNDLQAQNQADTVFRSDSLQKILVDHFNRHGTPNEQMLANYLLGRAYADMGEAPKALQSFLDAASCADTSDSKTDYHLLSVVHGQAGALFQSQNLPRYDIEQLTLASKYALREKDTLLSVTYESLKASEYYMLGDKDSSLIVLERSANQFEAMGVVDYAAILRGQSVMALLEKNNVAKATDYLRFYETYSGHVDSTGQACEGKELYYYWKGKLYLATNHPDSASLCFQQLLHSAKTFNNKNAAAEGLYKAYCQIGNKDSIAKYARMTLEISDSVYSRETASMLQMMQSQYNYKRYQLLAERRKHQLESGRWFILVLVLLFVFLFSVAIHMKNSYRKRMQMKESELLSALNAKEKDRKDLIHVQKELKELISIKTDLEKQKEQILYALDKHQSDNKKLITEKENEIVIKNKEIEEKTALVELLSKRMNSLQYSSERSLDSIYESAIYKRLSYLTVHPLNKVMDKEWAELESAIEEIRPNVKTTLCGKNRIKTDEYHICLLILLHFEPGEIGVLLGLNHDMIAKKRRRLHKKLFGFDGVPSDFDMRLRQML